MLAVPRPSRSDRTARHQRSPRDPGEFAVRGAARRPSFRRPVTRHAAGAGITPGSLDRDRQSVRLKLAAEPDKGLEHVRRRRGIRARAVSYASELPRVFRTGNLRLIARRFSAVTVGSPRGCHRRGDREPGLAAGEDGSAQLRRRAGDRDRPAEALRPGRLRAGTGMPGHPRLVLAAAAAVRWNASQTTQRSDSPHRRAKRPGT